MAKQWQGTLAKQQRYGRSCGNSMAVLRQVPIMLRLVSRSRSQSGQGTGLVPLAPNLITTGISEKQHVQFPINLPSLEDGAGKIKQQEGCTEFSLAILPNL